MTAVAALAVLLGAMVTALLTASGIGTRIALSHLVIASAVAGGAVALLVVLAGMLALGVQP